MIIGTAVAIVVVTVVVIRACYKATGISIQLNNVDLKNEDKSH